MSLVNSMLLDRHSNIFDAFRGFPSDDSGAGDVHMDWKEAPEAHVFKADLPGVRKGDVKVEVEDGRVLSISGQRSGDPIDDDKERCEWHCSERSRGRFHRRFRLPEDAKADEMKASMEDGVLTLIVPKRQMKKPEVRSVEITGGASKKRGKGKDVVCCSFWPL